MIVLKDITFENLSECESLERKDTRYVGSPLWVIAEAYLHRDNTTAHAIYIDNTIVGLVCLIWDKKSEYSFANLLIADNHQGLGYGKKAVKAIIDIFKKENNHQTI